MNDARHLFRQSALDRLLSPDQLDRLLPVTAPTYWFALIGFAVMVGAGLNWAFTGSVASRVEGSGVFLARGGSIVDAMTVSGGTLSALPIQVGEEVAEGQVVARLAQPALQQSVDNARLEASELAAEHDRLAQQFARETKLKKDVLARQRAAQQSLVESESQRAAYYRQTLHDLEHQIESGYITRQRMQDALQEVQTAEQNQSRGASELTRLDGEELDDGNRHDDELTKAALRVSEADRRLVALQGQLQVASEVLAPTAGTVTEVKVHEGAFMSAGTPLVSIQTGSTGLEYVLYVPLAHGKEIKPGMTVQIEPATVKKEEFGTLLGTVASISDFPASTQGMMAALQNGDLVRQFSTPTPPYVARVRLETRAGEAGRYAWSSGSEPPIAITSGTLARADVTVRRQHPAALVFPALAEAIGLGW